MPPFEREIDRQDPLIDHKHRKSQISGETNWAINFFLPLAAICVTGAYRRSALDIHHGCLALYSGRGLSEVITEVLKNRVGRLRPDFLSRCEWDKTLKSCTGDVVDILDGRRSFPSGHSSTAFSGMMFLSLWLAGMTGAWCITRSAPARSLLSSKLARLIFSILPLAFATWVAISRVEDNRHHKEDVIVGGLIGVISATICYFIYWPSPFAPQTGTLRYSARARNVYSGAGSPAETNGYAYELAGMEHANGMDSV
ncbi:acid phosphatase/Vanadium-dependent haloperoxidase [Wolfiporia cocos MD-104 SS10]|uniref:Acid phosphatase/Vanadium-dependent haloperoxidase n=1 Tax=Wolfiporia cocos (strain MD-104) TaxID=742152 RepID=A0A2H3J264_WOLCO|nr:acid phosphatase/Vanadium-dependent haloperoxidase [Wolfiporia cocos MD-104 SS10]